MQAAKLRKVVMRLWGEETRRFLSDIVVEVPDSVPDEKIESMWLSQFDGVPDLDWTLNSTTGIWPSNCGRRLQPEVRRSGGRGDVVQIRLLRSPRGNLVVACLDPRGESGLKKQLVGKRREADQRIERSF
jgi:hypothetical protein